MEKQKNNKCRHYFIYVSIFPGAWAAALAGTISGIPSGSYQMLVLALLASGLSVFLGDRFYKKQIGPWLRGRGWNEYSYLRGLQLAITGMTIGFTGPLLVLVACDKFWHLIKH
ncbi:MAG: hypothetical protein KBC81_02010 [Candidatus Pacebacteria bacterium]|nr:hypothetical protein [Candidatus Paceibacterota bacterium]